MTENMIRTVKINRISRECMGVKTISFKLGNKNIPKPGQFVMVWVPGVDEIPMSISGYEESGNWSITVKNVGECTNALHNLNIGDYIGIRGPLGTHFKMPSKASKHIFLIGGGFGMAPLKFLANQLKKFSFKFKIIEGAKSKDELIYLDELFNVNNDKFFCCTDDGSYGQKGLTTELFEEKISEIKHDDLKNTIVYTCGPEIMMFRLFQICKKYGIELFVSLERIMRCGCGLCGLCAIDPVGILVCKDGPVFNLTQLDKMDDFGKYKRDFTGKKIKI
ncbi:MAG: dihydroorotate dehydrogenase electron transfer subunit [Promethearchaeota archaeon]